MSSIDVLYQIFKAFEASKASQVGVGASPQSRSPEAYMPSLLRSARKRTESTDQRFLRAIPDKGASTSQISITMGTSSQGILRRLKEMKDRDLLTCEKLSGYGVRKMDVWKKVVADEPVPEDS